MTVDHDHQPRPSFLDQLLLSGSTSKVWIRQFHKDFVKLQSQAHCHEMGTDAMNPFFWLHHHHKFDPIPCQTSTWAITFSKKGSGS